MRIRGFDSTDFAVISVPIFCSLFFCFVVVVVVLFPYRLYGRGVQSSRTPNSSFSFPPRWHNDGWGGGGGGVAVGRGGGGGGAEIIGQRSMFYGYCHPFNVAVDPASLYLDPSATTPSPPPPTSHPHPQCPA